MFDIKYLKILIFSADICTFHLNKITSEINQDLVQTFITQNLITLTISLFSGNLQKLASRKNLSIN